MEKQHAVENERDGVRMRALEMYLSSTKMSSLRILQDLEIEALLHRSHTDGRTLDQCWSLLIANARNVVQATQNCIHNCGSVELMKLSKAESAFLLSEKAARMIGQHEPQIYLKASNMMLQSEQCLSIALDAQTDRDRALGHLWTTAAEAVSEAANILVLSLSDSSGAVENVNLVHITEIAEARTNAAECKSEGKTHLASRWRQLARLLSVASAKQCLSQYGHRNEFDASDQRAQRYRRCLLASIKLDSSIAQVRAQQHHWAADLLCASSVRFETVLDASDLPLDVELLISKSAADEAKVLETVNQLDELRSSLENCAERAAHYERIFPDIAVAWTYALQHTQEEIVALYTAVQCIDSVSLLPKYHRCLTSQAGDDWCAVARWMDSLHEEAVCADGRVEQSATDQERQCYSTYGSLLHQQLDFCASFVAAPGDRLAAFKLQLPLMTAAKALRVEFKNTITPLHVFAQHMRACAIEAPQYAAQLTAVAAWFEQRAIEATRQLCDQLAVFALGAEDAGSTEQELARIRKAPRQLQRSHYTFDWQLCAQIDSNPCATLLNPAAEVCFVNGVLTALLSVHQRYAGSLEADSGALSATVQSLWEPWESERSKCINSANALDHGDHAIAALWQAALAFKATAAHLRNAAFAPPIKGKWCCKFPSTLSIAARLCSDMAACVQYAIGAANDGERHLIAECTAAVEALSSVHLRPLDTADQVNRYLLNEEHTQECQQQLQAAEGAHLRRLWNVALFHNYRARVAMVSGDSEQAVVLLTAQATRHREVAKLTTMVPTFRDRGHHLAADLCEHASVHLSAGGDLSPDFVSHMESTAEHLPRLDAHRKHCQEKAHRCRDPALRKVWAHVANLSVFSTTGIVDGFIADPAAVPFDRQGLQQLVASIATCVITASSLEGDAALLKLFSAKLGCALQLPSTPAATGIQDCWHKAVDLLRQHVDASATVLCSATPNSISASTSELNSARARVYFTVREYTKIVYNYFEPANYATCRSASALTNAPSTSNLEAEVKLQALWLQVAQEFACLGQCFVEVLKKHSSGSLNRYPKASSRFTDAQRKLASVEHLAAALKATDLRVREAYYAAHRHGGVTGGMHGDSIARLHAELAYNLEKGVPEERLQALRVACMYAESTDSGHRELFSGASCLALRAHRLGADQAERVSHMLCAAKWIQLCEARDSISSDAKHHESNMLSLAARLVTNDTSTVFFYSATAVEVLRLTGLDRHVHFTVDINGIPSSAQPLIARYAAAVVEHSNAVNKTDHARYSHWYTVFHAYKLLYSEIETVVNGILRTAAGPSTEAAAALVGYHAVAELHKKAALASDAGHRDLSECWGLAAETRDPRGWIARSTPQFVEIAQRFAQAAEALQAGQTTLYTALRSAAQLHHQRADTENYTQNYQLKFRAADVLVEAARAECAGKHAAAELFYAAADKFTLASQNFNKDLVQEGDRLQARAVAELAVQPM